MTTSFVTTRKRLNLLFGLALPVALGVLLSSGCGKRAAAPMIVPPPDVVVKTVEKREVQLYLRTIGSTGPYEDVKVVARVPGYLEKILFEPGKSVRQGDPLFIIEQDSYRIALDSAEADLKICQANEALAKANLDRAKELHEQKTIPDEEYETKVSSYKTALANIERAKAAVEQAKLNLSYTDIRSPIEGKTDKKYVDVGNYVGQGGAPTELVKVTRMNPILVDFEISDTQFNMLNQKKNFVRELKLGWSKPVEETNRTMKSKPVFTQVAATVASDEPATLETTAATETVDASEAVDVEKAANVAEEGALKQIAAIQEAPASEEKFPFEIDFLSTDPKAANYTYRGELTAIINNEIGATVGAITLRGEIPNPDMAMFPGQICRVRIPVEKVENAVLVHEEAIMTDLDMKYVVTVVDGETEVPDMIDVVTTKKVKGETVSDVVKKYQYNDDGSVLMKKVPAKLAKRTPVKLGQQVENGLRIITEGLQGGETYIVQGTQKARFDHPVKIVEN